MRRRRIRNKHSIKTKIYIFVFFMLTLSIGLGYAYLQEQLSINGSTIVSKNVWDVHFSPTGANNTINDSSSHMNTCANTNQCSTINSAAAISSDGSAVDFSVTFHVVGDYYEFYVDVVNDGTIDAMLSSYNIQGITAANEDYIDVDVMYADDSPLTTNDLLAKCGGTEHIRVRVTFTSAPEDDVYCNFSFVMNYVQANSNASERQYNPEGVIRTYNTEGATISTTDHSNELRFIGKNPNNYVYFNGNQKWRIIGVFNGQLKLVQDPIGSYSWDSSLTTVNNGYGVNQWGTSTLTNGTAYTGADLMKLLNPGFSSNTDYVCKTTVTNTSSKFHCGDDDVDNDYTNELVNNSLYWNGSSGKCYNNGGGGAISCDFSNVGLTDTKSRSMIDENATWYLGSLDTPSANIWDGRITASLLYSWERSSSSGKQCTQNSTYCSDTVNRDTTWTGRVGLIYPSDYAYATGGSASISRSDCLNYTVGYVDNSEIHNWSNTYTDCKNNDWLLNTSTWQWTMTPRASSSYSLYLFPVDTPGYVNANNAYNAGSVRPVVYLKSSVSFTGNGNGTQSNPYKLKITQ